MDYEYFTIPYVTDTIPNSPDGHQLPTQSKKKLWITAINGEEPITAQCALDELNHHQTIRKNPRSRSVYAEERDSRGKILKRFVPALIKLCL